MATTVININSVEWSSNPVTVAQATLVQIYVTKSVTDTITCSSSTLCATNLLCGSQVTIETVLTN